MKELLAVPLLLLLQYGVLGQEARVTPNGMIDLDATECHQLVVTCTARRLQSLNWFFNSDIIVNSFTFRPSIEYPYDFYDASGLDIDVVSVNAESLTSDVFNGTSVLNSNTLALSLLGVNTIQCGTNAIRNNSLVLGNVRISPIVDQCSLTSSVGTVTVSFQWPSSFTSQHAVKWYRVSVSPDPSSCSSDQVSPSQVYTCSGLVPQDAYNFTVSAVVNCDGQNQEGQTNSFSVELQAPQIMDTFMQVLPIYYDQSYKLSEVFVEWDEEPQRHISRNCTFSQLIYTVVLVNSIGQTVNQEVVSSTNCNDGTCSSILAVRNSKEDESYQVSINVSNNIGQSKSNSSMSFAGSVSDRINVTTIFENCLITVTSSSFEIGGNYSIAYSRDSSHQVLSDPMNTSLNSPITLPLLEAGTKFYFLVTVTDSSSKFQIKGNFSVEAFPVKLTTFNIGLVVIGVAFFCVAFLSATLQVAVECITGKGSWLSLILMVVSVVLLLACMFLWITVCAVVIPQKNTCDSTWQSTRDRLIVSSFVLSLLFTFSEVAAIVMTFIACKKLCFSDRTDCCRSTYKNIVCGIRNHCNFFGSVDKETDEEEHKALGSQREGTVNETGNNDNSETYAAESTPQQTYELCNRPEKRRWAWGKKKPSITQPDENYDVISLKEVNSEEINRKYDVLHEIPEHRTKFQKGIPKYGQLHAEEQRSPPKQSSEQLKQHGDSNKPLVNKNKKSFANDAVKLNSIQPAEHHPPAVQQKKHSTPATEHHSPAAQRNPNPAEKPAEHRPSAAQRKKPSNKPAEHHSSTSQRYKNPTTAIKQAGHYSSAAQQNRILAPADSPSATQRNKSSVLSAGKPAEHHSSAAQRHRNSTPSLCPTTAQPATDLSSGNLDRNKRRSLAIDNPPANNSRQSVTSTTTTVTKRGDDNVVSLVTTRATTTTTTTSQSNSNPSNIIPLTDAKRGSNEVMMSPLVVTEKLTHAAVGASGNIGQQTGEATYNSCPAHKTELAVGRSSSQPRASHSQEPSAQTAAKQNARAPLKSHSHPTTNATVEIQADNGKMLPPIHSPALPQTEKSLESLSKEEMEILAKFKVNVNLKRADRGQHALSSEDTLKYLSRHGFNVEGALEEVEKQSELLYLTVSLPFLLQYGVSGQKAELIPSGIINLDATECQELILSCTTQRLHSHSWLFNSDIFRSFTFDPFLVYPYDLYDASGVDIDIISVDAESQNSDVFNGTSLLTSNTLALSLLGVSSIQCGTNAVRSNTLVFNHIQISPTVDSCSLASSGGVVSVSFQWSPSFTSQHAVEMYRVSVTPDPSSCSSDQVNSSQVYTCSGLNPETTYNITVSAVVNCDGQNQEGQPSTFSVQLQAPEITDTFKQVLPIYDQNFKLREVYIEWSEKPQSHISSNCTFNQLNYTVALVNSTKQVINQVIVSSADCSEGICSSALSIPTSFENEYYQVNVTVSNGISQSTSTSSTLLAGSVSDRIDITFESCRITVTSISLESGENYSVVYGQNSSYQDLSNPMNSSLNSFITLPLLQPRTKYFFLITVTNNSSQFQIKGNFSFEEFPKRLTVLNISLVVMGLVFFLMAFLSVSVRVVIECKGKGSRLSVVLLVVSALILVMCVILWSAFCAVVIPQKNTCDFIWQSTRDGLIISSFLLSLLVLLSEATGIIVCMKLCFNYSSDDKGTFTRDAEDNAQGQVYSTLNHEAGSNQNQDLLSSQAQTEYSTLEPGEANEEEYSSLQHNPSSVATAQDLAQTRHLQDKDQYSTLDPGQVILDLFHAKANSCRANFVIKSMTREEAYDSLKRNNFDPVDAFKEILQYCQGNFTQSPQHNKHYIDKFKAELKKAMKEYNKVTGDKVTLEDNVLGEDIESHQPTAEELADRDDHARSGTKGDEREGRKGEGSGVAVSKKKQRH